MESSGGRRALGILVTLRVFGVLRFWDFGFSGILANENRVLGEKCGIMGE